jgi:hypothetical protein
MASSTRRPDGRWRARYRDPDGREHARHFARKADADLWLATIQADILRGRYIDPTAARTTFKEYADRWREQQPHRQGTSRLYERTLRLHVNPANGWPTAPRAASVGYPGARGGHGYQRLQAEDDRERRTSRASRSQRCGRRWADRDLTAPQSVAAGGRASLRCAAAPRRRAASC